MKWLPPKGWSCYHVIDTAMMLIYKLQSAHNQQSRVSPAALRIPNEAGPTMGAFLGPFALKGGNPVLDYLISQSHVDVDEVNKRGKNI
jgi:hypothetical protein